MNQRPPPDLLVEQLALGELDEARAAALRRELAAEVEAGGRDRLAELDASNREILTDYPPERVAADIRRRLDREQPQRGRKPGAIWVLAPALAAAAVLVWVVTRDDGSEHVAIVESTSGGATLVDDGEPEQTRIKGGVEPYLVVDRKTAGGHERLAAGDQAGAGDLLQLSYVAAGRRAGVILSIDGSGVVTLHHPASAAAEAALADGSEVPLADAYELDDAPGFERFVFVTRDGGPIAVTEVLAAAERLAADAELAETAPLTLAGEGWTQHSLLLRKRPSDQPTPAGEEAGP